jgi:hypothetical protein
LGGVALVNLFLLGLSLLLDLLVQLFINAFHRVRLGLEIGRLGLGRLQSTLQSCHGVVRLVLLISFLQSR